MESEDSGGGEDTNLEGKSSSGAGWYKAQVTSLECQLAGRANDVSEAQGKERKLRKEVEALKEELKDKEERVKAVK